jgi:tetratricopeptide (TPR) repeat protein
MTKKIACPNCDADLTGLSNFCPNCGAALQIVTKGSTHITAGRFFILVVASLGLFIFGWLTQSMLSGKKPEKMFTASALSGESKPHNMQAVENNVDYNDADLEKARKLAKEQPLDIDIQKNFSKALLQKVKTFEAPPQALIFETIEALRNILNLDGNDPDALIAMADISFDQQAFGKAIEFYEKYLQIEKNDLNARARYASSLTFVGKQKEALEELASIIKKDPKNFHAKAYTAITYAQMGNIAEAKKFGNEALGLAPSPEAKERFTQFLKQLDVPKESAVRDNTKDAVTNNTKEESTDSPIVEYIKNNQIAGPKYRSHELNANNELIINFENFPMEAMPPFAKEKFFASLKEASKSDKNKPAKIIFRDVGTTPPKDLDVLPLP